MITLKSFSSPSSSATTSESELSSDMHRSAHKRQTFYISIKCTACCTAWPEGGSKVTHLCSGCWRWVSCTHSWFYAGTRPAAVPSLSSPPSCTAAAGPSSVAYWGSPQARVCGLPQKSAAEGPIQFPALATLSAKKKTNSDLTSQLMCWLFPLTLNTDGGLYLFI